MHHRFKKLAGALAAIGLAGLTMAGTSTAHAAVLPTGRHVGGDLRPGDPLQRD